MSNRKHLVTFHDPRITREALSCPSCGSSGSKVINTRAAEVEGTNLSGIGRERRCYACQYIYRTLEIGPETLEHLK